jgi:hypothetical protein
MTIKMAITLATIGRLMKNLAIDHLAAGGA